MLAKMYGAHSNETHDQFVQRASRVFPEHHASEWSRIERGVFNHLMAQLIHRYGYSEISNEMLQQSRADMMEIVKRLTGGKWGSANHSPDIVAPVAPLPSELPMPKQGTADSRNAYS